MGKGIFSITIIAHIVERLPEMRMTFFCFFCFVYFWHFLSKPNQITLYHSLFAMQGRPGWHVECSVMARFDFPSSLSLFYLRISNGKFVCSFFYSSL